MSSMVVMVCRLSLGDEEMLHWGWRIPFWIAAIPAYICLTRLHEVRTRLCCAERPVLVSAVFQARPPVDERALAAVLRRDKVCFDFIKTESRCFRGIVI